MRTIVKVLPEDIRQAINSVPPYQRDGVGKSYVGMTVRWELIFKSIYENGPEVWVILYPQDWGLMIHCRINLSQSPEFKIMKENQRVSVEGIIEAVDKANILLKDCKFGVLEETPSKDHKSQQIVPDKPLTLSSDNKQAKSSLRSFLEKFFWQFIVALVVAVLAAVIVYHVLGIGQTPSNAKIKTDSTSISERSSVRGHISTTTLNLSELLFKALDYETSVEKRDFLSKYMGEAIYSYGVVEDVSRSGERFMLDINLGQNVTIECFQDTNEFLENNYLFLKGNEVLFFGVFTYYTRLGSNDIMIDNCSWVLQ